MANEMIDKQTDIGASACAIPNGQLPVPHKPMFYGNQSVPHPTNSAAKIVHPAEVMRAVNEGK